MPTVEQLPGDAEATIDLPSDDLRPNLRRAYDSFQHNLSAFLRQSLPRLPDWIIFDYAAYWAPRVAAEFGVPCAFLGLHNAAVFSFLGTPAVLMGNEGARTTPEHFMEPPTWVPFPSSIFYKPYEARELFKPGALPDASGVSETYRFGKTMEDCQLIAIRSSVEFEKDWFSLLSKLHKKPVIPLGFFPPPPPEAEDGEAESIFQWLDEQKPGSVVYAAFGSEAKLTDAQVHEIGRGLEGSELPFVWALRGPAPDGFEERTTGRGVVQAGWAPQARVLAHRAVGGFLTHAGWNSVIEGLARGLALVLLPLMFDQGLNARELVEKGVGVEVERAEADGKFTGEAIARSLRLVVVEEEGEPVRAKAREHREVFGVEETNDRYVSNFIEHLVAHARRPT